MEWTMEFFQTFLVPMLILSSYLFTNSLIASQLWLLVACAQGNLLGVLRVKDHGIFNWLRHMCSLCS